MNQIDVLVIGRSCLDYIAVVNQFPGENQKMPLEFRLIEGGGQGGTSSCCISRLGGRVAEFPIVFMDRRVGKSKMSYRIVIEAFTYVTRLALSRRGRAGAHTVEREAL